MALGCRVRGVSANQKRRKSQIHRKVRGCGWVKAQVSMGDVRNAPNVTVRLILALFKGYPGKGPSSISVTRAAIGERSDRVKVTWAKSG